MAFDFIIAWRETRTRPNAYNKFAFTPNLKLTVESCIMQAKQCLGNYKMAGAFRLLQQIGENLENNK
ncbi:hypothetical protein AAH030_16140 [Phocaeicola vulgatus]|uniref:hypothetical protein n=1 Tax=Phocaeicola vulgatus TaxID=821 RepID=UPI0039B4BE94